MILKIVKYLRFGRIIIAVSKIRETIKLSKLKVSVINSLLVSDNLKYKLNIEYTNVIPRLTIPVLAIIPNLSI
jgi:hypothetical protein